MTSPLEPSATPNLATALADLPVRVRVHELARRAGLNSKQAIAELREAGVEVVSASSSVDREVAEAVLTRLLDGAADAAGRDEPDASAPDGASAKPGDRGQSERRDDDTEGDRHRRRGRRGRGRAKHDDDAPRDEARPETGAAAPDGAGTPDDGDGSHGDGARGGDGSHGDGSQSGDASQGGDGSPGGDSERSGRRRRRGGRGRRGGSGRDDAAGEHGDEHASGAPADSAEHGDRDQGEDGDAASETDSGTDSGADSGNDTGPDDGDGDSERSASRRRRRRRRRSGSSDDAGGDDPADTVVHVRESRSSGADVQGVKGSTRLEAKRQRRRDSRDSRRRPQILSEAEFLARRESVDRVMAVRQRGDLAQIALLEDGVLVEHFVSRSGSASMIGNVYLARVQNVLPSMEAAFVDIGKGRNAVLYAGEVNWDIAGLQGKERRIEQALSSGDTVLVQVSKDPIGHKGARLTTQISLPGRFLVYVPGGGATGISRKLPDTERKRLKGILDRIVPADAGVIIRTAAEGVGEDELAADVARLQAKWEEISAAAGGGSGSKAPAAPAQLYAEPDTLLKVIRDLFNSDISRLLIDGDDAWESVSQYVLSMAPELADRVSRYVGDKDVFAAFRIDEQITKALQRKVHLPSGGSLVIDRTEAMTVIDVNTGKFTGSGGNLEETVTRNNLEAAEEIVRQLRLRDIGGIIVVDFIDMVLESNRELVLRRLTECLGRDRTRHQVAEVTSLGLVQMTRKRMGLGLVEAFSEPCVHCAGRGIVLHDTPEDTGAGDADGADGGDRAKRKGRKRGKRDSLDESAKFEPLVVERVTADAKPDPRGPKPPALFRSAASDSAENDGSSAPDRRGAEPDGDETVAPAPDTEQQAEPAPARRRPAVAHRREPKASDGAVAAAEREPVPAAGPKAEPTASEIAAPTSGATSTGEPARDDQPAAAKPARRRRAASRPVGSPTSAAAVDIVLPATPSGTVDGAHPAASDPNSAAADTVAPKAAAPNAAAPTAGADGGPGGTGTADGAPPRRRRAATRAAGPASG